MAAPPTAPYRIRSSVVRDGLAGQFGTENDPVAYARFILAPGPHGLKKVLQECVDAGDKSKPLTDEWLIIEMGKHGYEVARRTIAKYRGRLGIPLARWRKEL